MSVLKKLTIALLLLTQLGMADFTALNSINELRWERRVLLVFCEPDERPDIAFLLQQNMAGLAERDMTWFLVAGDEILSNHEAPLTAGLTEQWRERFAPLNSPVDVLLIGKDGGLKQRSEQLDMGAVFGTVDGMSMRRREMRERQ